MSGEHSAESFIDHLARVSASVGDQAGVSATETAGQILSFLAKHPDWLGAFMKGGYFALPRDFWERGSLTWEAANGRVVDSQDLRLGKVVRRMRPLAIEKIGEVG